MRRVAILGNSHLAAFKAAEADIRARFPDLGLRFFGLPNPVLFQSRALDGAALRLAAPAETVADQVIDPTGPEPLDLAPFDMVLLTSHGFYLPHIVKAVHGLRILGADAVTTDVPMVSMACVTDMMRAHVRSYCKRLARFFPPLDTLLVVQGPYPTTQAAEMNALLKYMDRHPARDRLFETFETIVAEQCLAAGLPLLPPSAQLLDKPFFTQAQYARQRDLPAGTAPRLSDYTHVNATYASQVFADVMAVAEA